MTVNEPNTVVVVVDMSDQFVTEDAIFGIGTEQTQSGSRDLDAPPIAYQRDVVRDARLFAEEHYDPTDYEDGTVVARITSEGNVTWPIADTGRRDSKDAIETGAPDKEWLEWAKAWESVVVQTDDRDYYQLFVEEADGI